MVAENRVLNINFLDLRTSLPTKEVFFGQEDAGEIIGLAVSTLSSSVFINFRNQGLFAYLIGGQGQLLWSIGPMISQFGYRLGCRKDVTDCYFNSVPVIDQCEGSIYVRFWSCRICFIKDFLIEATVILCVCGFPLADFEYCRGTLLSVY